MLKRKFRLEFTGGVERVIEDLRIDFTSQEELSLVNLTSMADTCTISVYNLSIDSFKSFTTADRIVVKLYTGYEGADALDLTFIGVLKNVTGLKQRPNHITTFYAIPIGREAAEKEAVNYVGTSGDDAETTIRGVVAAMKMKIDIDDRVSKEVLAKKYRDQTLEGFGLDILNTIGSELSLMFSARGSEEGAKIVVLPTIEAIKMENEKNAIKIQPINLRGTPNAGVSTMDIIHRLDSRLFAGAIIDTGALIEVVDGTPNGITSLSGVPTSALHYADEMAKWAINDKYMIQSITHEGSNYTPDFTSKLSCVYFNAKGTGGSDGVS